MYVQILFICCNADSCIAKLYLVLFNFLPIKTTIEFAKVVFTVDLMVASLALRKGI